MSKGKKHVTQDGQPLTDEQKAAKRAEREAANRKRFVELAPKRVNNALRQLVNVGRCANRQNYSYSDQEAAKITSAIQEAAGICCMAFEDRGESRAAFTL